MAEGSTDQANAVDELLATVTDVTEQVADFTKIAQKASQSARNVGKKW